MNIKDDKIKSINEIHILCTFESGRVGFVSLVDFVKDDKYPDGCVIELHIESEHEHRFLSTCETNSMMTVKYRKCNIETSYIEDLEEEV